MGNSEKSAGRKKTVKHDGVKTSITKTSIMADFEKNIRDSFTESFPEIPIRQRL